MNNNSLIKTQVFNQTWSQLFKQVVVIILGSLFLSLTAQLSFPLPFTPIPISMQTLGIATLALVLGPYQALLAVLTYLGQATLGLPVLASGLSNPLWMFGPTAGYLMGFVLSSYVTGQLLKNRKSFSSFKIGAIFALNELIILLMGTFWLSFVLGKEQAFYIGFYPFMIGALCKITMATSGYRFIQSQLIKNLTVD